MGRRGDEKRFEGREEMASLSAARQLHGVDCKCVSQTATLTADAEVNRAESLSDAGRACGGKNPIGMRA